MQVILLATGEQNKLHPLTEKIPSPLLPLANRPVMAYTLEMLARQGFKQALVSLHHQPGEIESYFGSGARWGMRLEYILQRQAWGAAGALRWARRHLKETFLVIPADCLVDLDLHAAFSRHRLPAYLARYSARRLATCIAYSGELLDGNLSGRATQTHEGVFAAAAKSAAGWADTGMYILEPEVLDWIPQKSRFDIRLDLIPRLRSAGYDVQTVPVQGYWNPLNTFEDHQAAQRSLLTRSMEHPGEQEKGSRPYSLEAQGRQISKGIWLGRNSRVHPTAQLIPPVLIGENCRIGRGAQVGPEVVIEDYVLIGDEATILRSTVMAHTYVGRYVNIENRIIHHNLIVDIATAQSVRVTDPFWLSRVRLDVLERGLWRGFEIGATLLLLVVVSPLMLALGLLLLLLRQPVFETTACRRPPQGKGESRPDQEKNRAIHLIHYRTRTADGALPWMGRWLERLEWHRLPELFHVIKGDLGLVGVKPLPEAELDQLSEPWQKAPYDHQAGFTGIWYLQVGPRSDPFETAIADAYYAATKNWREDVKILLKTPAAWWRYFLSRRPEYRRRLADE